MKIPADLPRHDRATAVGPSRHRRRPESCFRAA